jgi:hypothetical protein
VSGCGARLIVLWTKGQHCFGSSTPCRSRVRESTCFMSGKELVDRDLGLTTYQSQFWPIMLWFGKYTVEHSCSAGFVGAFSFAPISSVRMFNAIIICLSCPDASAMASISSMRWGHILISLGIKVERSNVWCKNQTLGCRGVV